MCMDHIDDDRSEKLKSSLGEYFERQCQLENGRVSMRTDGLAWGNHSNPSVLDEVGS